MCTMYNHITRRNINGNGKDLNSFCEENNMTIMSTWFQHKAIHRGTWISPDKRTVNRLDHCQKVNIEEVSTTYEHFEVQTQNQTTSWLE